MVKKLTIDRALWGRNAMLRGDGRMCCLGHLARACGVPDTALDCVVMPSKLDASERAKLPSAFRNYGTDMFDPASEAATNNDSSFLSSEEIEAKLYTLFYKHGITLNFVGDRDRCRVGTDNPDPPEED